MSELNVLLCCPRCGSGDGCHCRLVETRQLFYNLDGTPCGGSEPHVIRGGTKLYCNDCDFDMTKIVTLDFSNYAT